MMVLDRIISDPEPKKQFGPLLREYRLAARLKQQDLAEAAQIPQSHVSDYENCIRNPPPRPILHSFAEKLNLDAVQIESLLNAAAGTFERNGRLVFLSSADIGFELSRCRSVWVIGRDPLEFDQANGKAVFDAIVRRIGGLGCVYWLPRDRLQTFDNFRARVERAYSGHPGIVAASLSCIESPEAICLHHFAIYDPLDTPRARIGAYLDQNRDCRAIPVAAEYAQRVRDYLQPVYAELALPSEHAEKEGLRFRKHFPK